MTMQLNPYLSFAGTAQEAMDFYADVLGGTVRAMTFKDAGMDAPGLMHAALETPTGFHLYASDRIPGMGPDVVQGNNMQVSLSGDETETLTRIWERLAEGGQVIVPLEKQMWGDLYGQVVDRFGVPWHVNVTAVPADA